MMNEAEINDFALIDLKTWTDCTQSAMATFHQPWALYFSNQICQFLIDTYGLGSLRPLLIFCGHPSRFEMCSQLIDAAVANSLTVHVVVPAVLKSAFQAQLKNTQQVLILSEHDDCPEKPFCALDLIYPLADSKDLVIEDALIDLINTCAAPKIAIECPSGINPNTGHMIAKKAVGVHYTLESFYSKQGLWTGDAKTYAGRKLLLLNSLGTSLNTSSFPHLMHEQFIKKIEPHRSANQHKGCFRRVIVIVGEKSMLGASLLAARGALVMGAGLVKLIYQKGLHIEPGRCPELIYQEVAKPSEMTHFIEEDDIIVFGPGLGQGQWAKQVWQTLECLNHRMVVDASALSQLAKHPSFRPNWVITPHPGEAAQLLHENTTLVQANRFQAIEKINQLYQATVVLKGAGTMVLGQGQPLYICPLGHPGMATPGMGDLLSGMIAGCWAQGVSSTHAAMYAVWMHAKAGDEAKKKSMSGIVLASQVLQQIQYGFH
jgi:hydroxyethylthiazole kinase-like uncharacterized protein yjeF